MTKYRRPYACPTCDGKALHKCPSCGNETDCDRCGGSGLNDAVVDVEAFEAAVEARRLPQGLCNRYSLAWIVDGVQVGVRFHDGDRLAVADFLRKKP